MEDTLKVVDPHIHIWDLSTGLYPRRAARGTEKTALSGDYLLDDLLADAGSIEIVKAVHVEAAPLDGLAEARHVQAIADTSGLPQGIVAYADLASADVAATLEALTGLANVRGIRQMLDREVPRPGVVHRDHLNDDDWHAGFGLLARFGLSFDLQVTPHQLAAAASLASAHPETQIVLNHLGGPGRRWPDWTVWRDGMRALGSHGNVWAKLSGFAMTDPGWTVESLRPYVYEALEAFGPGRCMFASNFPIDRQGSDYPTLWKAFAAVTTDLSDDERAGLMRANAERFYRI